MKRYLVFKYSDRDASGGMEDFCGDFDFWVEAIQVLVEWYKLNPNFHVGHIFDTETKTKDEYDGDTIRISTWNGKEWVNQ
jgi:hypothetical protein